MKLALLAAVAAAWAAPLAGAQPPPPAQTAAEGNVEFGVALYRKVAAKPGNVFLSPISIVGAFGPVSAGAEGETLAEIARALRLPAGAAGHEKLGGMLRGLEREREGVTLSIANALWVQQGFGLKPAFEKTARKHYDARVEALDFARNEAAAGRINGWVKEETRGRIGELINARSLNRETALVVTNAVYFLGDWATAFRPAATANEPFHLPGGETRTVPLMSRQDRFRYLETDQFQAIDLPYKDERLSMSVFLPRARDGLPAFEAGLDATRLREWLGRLDAERPRAVMLHLPKFRIGETYNLIPPLGAMGIAAAFTPGRADLSGIADQELFISQVIHKTFLKVDEKGTEAAAATGIGIQVTSAPPPPPVFRADHPFFLVIRDKASGAILFLGRIVSPDQA
jgi:serpin B